MALSNMLEYVQFYGPLGVTRIDLLSTLQEINARHQAKCTFSAIIFLGETDNDKEFKTIKFGPDTFEDRIGHDTGLVPLERRKMNFDKLSRFH